ncbi:MAG TPA: carboxypeptidase-like regulatory domain-containing protein [Pedobacter sp.]|nr:carboxypeptidase-like regulatory domain-containing protein [Pedobacter sp.]
MQISTLALAQKITVKKKEAKLQTIFKEIRKQSGYDFLYNEEVMKHLKPINIDVKNASIEQAMDSAFSDVPLKYAIHDRLVMISAKDTVKIVSKKLTISGMIRDRKGLPIPGASVYLSHYKIGVSADNMGRFFIPNLSPGSYTVLAQMIGYQPASQNIMLSLKSAEFDMVMEEAVSLLNEVVVRPDMYRAQRLKLFKDAFLGTSKNARSCKILNEDALYFDYNKDSRTLMANANEFITIENKALGYRIHYLLEYFQLNEETSYVHFYGYPYFEELETDPSKRRRYAEKRRLAYAGSPQHFFNSLYNGTSKVESFLINKMIKAPNPERQPDVLIDKRIKIFSENLRKGIKVRRAKDSLKYWLDMKKAPDTLEVLVRKEVFPDSMVKEKSGHLKTMSFKDALYIIYQGEKETADFRRHPEYRIKRPDDLGRSQISLVYQLNKYVSFYENGGVDDPGSLLYEGVWAYKMVGDMLPLDYLMPYK